MGKFLFRPIFITFTLTTITALIYGIYNASLSGGEGGMIAGVAFLISIITGIIAVVENFIVKNSAASKKELLISELIILFIGIALLYYTISY